MSSVYTSFYSVCKIAVSGQINSLLLNFHLKTDRGCHKNAFAYSCVVIYNKSVKATT